MVIENGRAYSKPHTCERSPRAKDRTFLTSFSSSRENRPPRNRQCVFAARIDEVSGTVEGVSIEIGVPAAESDGVLADEALQARAVVPCPAVVTNPRRCSRNSRRQGPILTPIFLSWPTGSQPGGGVLRPLSHRIPFSIHSRRQRLYRSSLA